MFIDGYQSNSIFVQKMAQTYDRMHINNLNNYLNISNSNLSNTNSSNQINNNNNNKEKLKLLTNQY